VIESDALGFGELEHALIHLAGIDAEDIHAALQQRKGGTTGRTTEIESSLASQIELIPATPRKGLFELQPGTRRHVFWQGDARQATGMRVGAGLMLVMAEKERFGIGFTDDHIENQIAVSIRQPSFELNARLLKLTRDFGVDGVDALPFRGLDTVFIRDAWEDMEAHRLGSEFAGMIDDFGNRFAQTQRSAADTGKGAERSRRAKARTAHLPGDELRFHERRRELTGKVRGDVALEHGF
jgi:hypothetical protein